MVHLEPRRHCSVQSEVLIEDFGLALLGIYTCIYIYIYIYIRLDGLLCIVVGNVKKEKGWIESVARSVDRAPYHLQPKNFKYVPHATLSKISIALPKRKPLSLARPKARWAGTEPRPASSPSHARSRSRRWRSGSAKCLQIR